MILKSILIQTRIVEIIAFYPKKNTSIRFFVYPEWLRLKLKKLDEEERMELVGYKVNVCNGETKSVNLNILLEEIVE